MNCQAVWGRLVAHWRFKLFLGSGITAAFWIGYSLLERFPVRPPTRMPELALDRLIPFLPGAAFVYLSQFFTMPLAIWLLASRRQLWACCRALALLIGASFVVFFLCPTSIARPELARGSRYLYDLITGADLPRNACPSLHAAFGVFTAVCAWEAFRDWKHSRWLIGLAWLWTGGVLASTLLIKQHVFLDLMAGVALGVAGCRLARWPERATSGSQTLRAGAGSAPMPGTGNPRPEGLRLSESAGMAGGTPGRPAGGRA